MFTTEETTFADIDFFFSFLSSFIFKENHTVAENNSSQKNVPEKLHGIDIDDNENLEDLLIVFVYEECWDLKVFVGGEELTRHIN